MSRLLVIEPNLMLRYGLAVALTPDHVFQFVDGLPQALGLKDFDCAIVDAVTLRQAALGTVLDRSATEGWARPTVWIDDTELPSSRRVNWVQLKPPVQREQLLRALFECLNPTGDAPSVLKRTESSVSKPAKARSKKVKEGTAEPADGRNVIELIDLVEVVDDEPDNA